MSLRATGEGHVSSIVFRTGVIYSDHRIQIDPPSRLTRPVRVVPDKQYDKPLFRASSPTSGSPKGLRTSYSVASPILSPRPNSNMPLPRLGRRHPSSSNREIAAGHSLVGPLQLSVGAVPGIAGV